MVSPSSGAKGKIGNLGTLGRPDKRVVIGPEKASEFFSLVEAESRKEKAKPVPDVNLDKIGKNKAKRHDGER
jgi:hypothetical protein